MTALSIIDRELAFESAKHLVKTLKQRGLEVTFSAEFDEFARTAEEVPDPLGVSGTFKNWSDKAFWIACRAGSHIVAHRACDIIETESLTAEIESWRLFRKLPPLDWRPLRVTPGTLEGIAGKVGFGGGVWTHPDYRGQGIATALSKMTRYCLLGFHDIDFFVGLIEGEKKSKEFGEKKLGLQHAGPVISGFYPGRDAEMEVHIISISAEDILKEARAAQLPN